MPEAAERIRFAADRGDARLRLDQVLVRRLGAVLRISRTRAQRWIAAGAVLVDGAPATRASIGVREGAVIEVAPPSAASRRARPAPENLSLAVLYEDTDLLAIDKPAGQVVHPTCGNTSGTLLNAVLWRLRGRPAARPGIVGRLDRGTSGVVVVALSPAVHARLQRAASAGKLRKEYVALVRGTPRPSRGAIELPLGRDARDRRRVAVRQEGAASITRYEVIASARDVSAVRCELVTGRTHQIRVHLAGRGWPILGDATYGVPHPALQRQALHAWRVHLDHPVRGDTMSITAPVPEDMREAERALWADLKVGPYEV